MILNLNFNNMVMMKTISTRVDDELHEWIRIDAEERGISISEWLNDVVMSSIDGDSDDLTWDDLNDMEWDELVEMAEVWNENIPEDVEEDCEIDIDDYSGNWWSGNDDHGLAVAIAEVYDIEVEEDE